MIFDNDYTSLGSVGAAAIPMAEGHDCSYGAALSLVEAARNDMIMFESLLKIEAAEIGIMRESAGYVQEGQLQSLRENALSGIWNKIKELLSKLLAKVKAIFHTFLSKLDGLVKSNKQLVKKYGAEVRRKSNLDKMEVKWRKMKNFDIEGEYNKVKTKMDGATNDDWKSDSDDRVKYFTDQSGISDYREWLEEQYWDNDEPQIYELKDVSSSIDLCNYLENCDKDIKDVNRKIKVITRGIENQIKDADRHARDLAREKTSDPNAVSEAQHKYEMTVTYQSIVLAAVAVYQETMKTKTAQYKAAFMKAIAVNDKKLAEHADMIAEAAADEVEDVLTGAISSKADYTDLGTTNNAPFSVKDGDVTDDPEVLIADYGNDPDYKEAKTDGSIGTNYNGKESFFGINFV